MAWSKLGWPCRPCCTPPRPPCIWPSDLAVSPVSGTIRWDTAAGSHPCNARVVTFGLDTTTTTPTLCSYNTTWSYPLALDVASNSLLSSEFLIGQTHVRQVRDSTGEVRQEYFFDNYCTVKVSCAGALSYTQRTVYRSFVLGDSTAGVYKFDIAVGPLVAQLLPPPRMKASRGPSGTFKGDVYYSGWDEFTGGTGTATINASIDW